MTEQSPSDRLNRASNDIFEATSFLNGTNAAFVEQMYAAWLANPASVHESWQSYFAQVGEQGLHLRAGLEVLFARKAAHALGVAEQVAVRNTHAGLMGLKVVLFFAIAR